MKREKNKLILVYILMLLVIVLVIALTLVILNNSPKETHKESKPSNTPAVDINPYPTISDECTFDLTLADYSALTGPKCKGGYSRYNLNNINLGDSKLNIVIIYSDKNGAKSGLYVNNTRVINKADNLLNIRLGIFDNKLFILDKNNNEANVLVYNSNGENVYNLKDTLEEVQIIEPNFQSISSEPINTKTIDQNSFSFENSQFSFQTRLIANNQTITGSKYIVSFTGEDFSNPILNTQNQG